MIPSLWSRSGSLFSQGDLDGEMVLKVLAGDAVEEMTLGEYLVGVVRAESRPPLSRRL